MIDSGLALLFAILGIAVDPIECSPVWQVPADNERPFLSVLVGSDTFKLAAGSNAEFVEQCADEGDIIRSNDCCLSWARRIDHDYREFLECSGYE